jgi:hypothetical protein
MSDKMTPNERLLKQIAAIAKRKGIPEKPGTITERDLAEERDRQKRELPKRTSGS